MATEILKHITVRISVWHYNLVNEVARAEGMTVSNLMRGLLNPEELRERLAMAKKEREERSDGLRPR